MSFHQSMELQVTVCNANLLHDITRIRSEIVYYLNVKASVEGKIRKKKREQNEFRHLIPIPQFNWPSLFTVFLSSILCICYRNYGFLKERSLFFHFIVNWLTGDVTAYRGWVKNFATTLEDLLLKKMTMRSGAGKGGA